jgi:hypothetical protein
LNDAQHDVANAHFDDAGQQMSQERQTGHRQHRLGCRQRQRTQARALTADQDNRVHLRGIHRGNHV